MKSLGSLAFLGLMAFYIAWPAYSGYEIKAALDARNAERLSAKVDFPSLRASLRPAVAVKVEKMLVETLRQAGPSRGPLTDELRAQLMPPIIDGVLAVLVTPETLIRIHAEGATMKDAIDMIVAERAGEGVGIAGLLSKDAGAGASESTLSKIGKAVEKIGLDPNKALGGLFSKKEAPQPQATPPTTDHRAGPAYGLENIKRFGLNGPLGVAVGLAQDPRAREPDLTAEMSFVGGDWKLTGLVPKI
jgi:hypothetical protein